MHQRHDGSASSTKINSKFKSNGNFSIQYSCCGRKEMQPVSSQHVDCSATLPLCVAADVAARTSYVPMVRTNNNNRLFTALRLHLKYHFSLSLHHHRTLIYLYAQCTSFIVLCKCPMANKFSDTKCDGKLADTINSLSRRQNSIRTDRIHSISAAHIFHNERRSRDVAANNNNCPLVFAQVGRAFFIPVLKCCHSANKLLIEKW